MDLVNRVLQENRVNVLCVVRKDSGLAYRLLKVHRVRNELKVLNFDRFESRSDLEAAMEVAVPVILLIDGKGTLNKKIDPKLESDTGWLGSFDWSAMHYTSFQAGDFKFYSICKRSLVDEELKRLAGKKYQVVDFYIGALTALLLKRWLPFSRIVANDSVFTFLGEIPIGLAKNDPPEEPAYTIVDRSFTHQEIPLYGAVVNYFMPQESLERSSSELINKDEIRYRHLFNVLGKSLVIATFIILLTVYGASGFLSDKIGVLRQTNLNLSATHTQIEKLVSEKKSKLVILNEMGYGSSRFITRNFYDIVKIVPPDIRITHLSVFPLENEIKEGKKVNFTTGTIMISCSTRGDNSLNELISQIRSYDWVEKVEVVSLRQDKKENAYFDVKISVRNV